MIAAIYRWYWYKLYKKRSSAGKHKIKLDEQCVGMRLIYYFKNKTLTDIKDENAGDVCTVIYIIYTQGKNPQKCPANVRISTFVHFSEQRGEEWS